MTQDDAVRVRVRVPAKINLFLTVDGVRDDGFHDLTTVYQSIGLHDVLTAGMASDPARLHPAHRRRLCVRLRHDAGPDVPAGGDNLVVRASRALLRAMGVPDRGEGSDDALAASLELEKSIPVAAGMAGGSADAAAALVALNELWEAGMSRHELAEIGAGLGADVPFCVMGGTALASGTGTELAPVMARGEHHWVVATASQGLSTPEVFGAWDKLATSSPPPVDGVLSALCSGSADELAASLHNDLEAAAVHLRPSLADDLDRLRGAGALAAIVSGSGPTVLGLARDEAHADDVAAAVRGHHPRVVVAASPVGGPVTTRLAPTAAK